MWSPLFRRAGIPDDAFFDLTTDACRRFNERVPDAPGVRYCAIAGVCERPWLGAEWRFPARIVGRAEGSNDGVGISVCLTDDLTGDGLGDLLVGATGQGDGGFESRGAVYLLSGADSGQVYLSSALLKLDGADRYDRFGRSLAAADLDGDGQADLVAGAWTASGNDGNGAVYVLAGPFDGSESREDAVAVRSGVAASDYAGIAVAAVGDVDGDGIVDLLIGASGAAGRGAAYLLVGAPTGAEDLSGAYLRIEGDADGDEVGLSLDGGVDLDADGKSEIIVGAPGADAGGADAGAAGLYYGASGGVVAISDADLWLVGPAAGDRAPWGIWGRRFRPSCVALLL